MSGAANTSAGPDRARVLLVYLGWLANVARIHRQLDFLGDDCDVIVASYDPPGTLPGVRLIQLPHAETSPLRRLGAVLRAALRAARLYRLAYWSDAVVLRTRRTLQSGGPVDAVLVNSLSALPLAFDLGAPVVFDAHEHWTSESASWSRRQRLSMRAAHEWLVDRYATRAAAISSVSRGIVEAYTERTGIAAALVTNAPLPVDIAPSEVSTPIRLVHLGLADERRRLEDTIDAVASTDGRFTLDLVLAREGPYRDLLVQRAAATGGRVRVLPAIPNETAIAFLNAYDVGVFLLPANFPNQVHVLPNKLFDYIQARLAVAIGPSPEMAAIVHDWGCGVVSEDFTPAALAQALSSLTPQRIAAMKAGASRAARVLNAEQNRETVRAMVIGAAQAAK